jgi:hypothetical protein
MQVGIRKFLLETRANVKTAILWCSVIAAFNAEIKKKKRSHQIKKSECKCRSRFHAGSTFQNVRRHLISLSVSFLSQMNIRVVACLLF